MSSYLITISDSDGLWGDISIGAVKSEKEALEKAKAHMRNLISEEDTAFDLSTAKYKIELLHLSSTWMKIHGLSLIDSVYLELKKSKVFDRFITEKAFFEKMKLQMPPTEANLVEALPKGALPLYNNVLSPIVRTATEWSDIKGVSDTSLWIGKARRPSDLMTEKEFNNLAAERGVCVDKREVRHLPATWCRMKGIRIMDPDGWREDKKSYKAPLTENDFMSRMAKSTVVSLPNDTGYEDDSNKTQEPASYDKVRHLPEEWLMLIGRDPKEFRFWPGDSCWFKPISRIEFLERLQYELFKELSYERTRSPQKALPYLPGGKSIKYESSLTVRASAKPSFFQEVQEAIRNTNAFVEGVKNIAPEEITIRILKNQALILRSLKT